MVGDIEPPMMIARFPFVATLHRSLQLRVSGLFLLVLWGALIGAPRLLIAQNFELEQLTPPTDGEGGLGSDRARSLAHLDWEIGLLTGYSEVPLRQEIGGAERVLVAQQISNQVVASLGLWDRVTLGLSLPLLIRDADLDGGGPAPPLAGDQLGDLRVRGKIVLSDQRSSALGFALLLDSAWALSAGADAALASEGATPTLRPGIAIGSQWEYLEVYSDLRAHLRAPAELSGEVVDEGGQSLPRELLSVGPGLLWKAGLSGRYLPNKLHQLIEVHGEEPFEATPGGSRLEILSGLRLLFEGGSHFTLGVGWPLQESYSAPRPRLFLGLLFHPSDPDSDGDGFKDSEDQCPRQREDFDNFRDEDGCPELDNDGDGIPDTEDRCPLEPEDQNEFEDDDGCPDGTRDLDRDGIVDARDRCPLEAEDLDQFEDEDGCPETDNDGDQRPDTEDQCPRQPEDFDGFEDEDGCPDRDNDQDGIRDAQDRCPDLPEDRDGVADHDGCPEISERVSAGPQRLEISEKIYFALGRARIQRRSFELLLEVARLLNENPRFRRVEIQGHTDKQGRARSNLRLSQARAESVRRFLIREGSVDAARLIAKGYGSSRLLEEGESAEAHQTNRRVEFHILPDQPAETEELEVE